MGAIGRYYYGGAGESGMRRYRELARSWRVRTFGRRTDYYFWLVLTLAAIAAFEFTSPRWRFGEGLLIGMVGMSFMVLPDTLMPDHIARRERGAWGEQQTARALRPLRKQGWLIRHDLATGYRTGNRDHIAVGPAVYLLDTKMLRDEVWIDQAGVHVRRVDETREEYVIPDLSERMRRAANSLKRDLDATVGFPVAVYPVVVIWGHFAAGESWDGNVAYVDGECLAGWLDKRPVDLLAADKCDAVKTWLRALPRA